MYECTVCKKKAEDYSIIWECEAMHLGLTPVEIEHFKKLREPQETIEE